MPTHENDTIISRLIRMEEKLDGYLFRTTRLETRGDDHDRRLNALEAGSAKLLAGVSVVAFLAASFGSSIIAWAH